METPKARWDPALSVAAQAPQGPPCATASGPWARMLATAAARLPRCDVRGCGKGDFLCTESAASLHLQCFLQLLHWSCGGPGGGRGRLAALGPWRSCPLLCGRAHCAGLPQAPSLLERDGGRPRRTVHFHSGLGPVPDEDARGGLRAQASGFPVVPVQLVGDLRGRCVCARGFRGAGGLPRVRAPRRKPRTWYSREQPSHLEQRAGRARARVACA